MTDQEQGTIIPADPSVEKTIKEVCIRPEAGHICPGCHKGILDTNGLLNLVCTHCGREWISSIT